VLNFAIVQTQPGLSRFSATVQQCRTLWTSFPVWSFSFLAASCVSLLTRTRCSLQEGYVKSKRFGHDTAGVVKFSWVIGDRGKFKNMSLEFYKVMLKSPQFRIKVYKPNPFYIIAKL